MTDPIPNIDIAALAYDAEEEIRRRAVLEAGFWISAARDALAAAERVLLTAGKVVGGPLSAESPDGTDPAKAPPPADGPGIGSVVWTAPFFQGGKGGGRESGADEEKADPRSLPPSSGNAAANPASPAISDSGGKGGAAPFGDAGTASDGRPAASPAISDSGGKGGERENGVDNSGVTGSRAEGVPRKSGSSAAANPASPANLKDAEAATAAQKAALEAAQDREDAVRGSNILTALQQGTLSAKAAKALGARWPVPRDMHFGNPNVSLLARLQKAGTIAVGRWCRTHDIKEGE